MNELENEVYECTGCGGEVSVVEALWFPLPLKMGDKPEANPYCCKECYE